jgi:hypothetical protein
LRTVWRLQTDVERWPSWQPSVTSAERVGHGPLRAGSAFRWATPIPPGPATPATELEITSTVGQLRRHACLRWTGPQVDANVPTATELLRGSLEGWLRDLKTAAEARTHDRQRH